MIIAQAPYRISFAGGGTDLPAFYRHQYGDSYSNFDTNENGNIHSYSNEYSHEYADSITDQHANTDGNQYTRTT